MMPKRSSLSRLFGEDRGQLNAASILVVDIARAAIDDAEATGVVWLMVGEARITNIAAVLCVQRVIHFADDRPVRLAEGRGADLIAGQAERAAFAGVMVMGFGKV